MSRPIPFEESKDPFFRAMKRAIEPADVWSPRQLWAIRIVAYAGLIASVFYFGGLRQPAGMALGMGSAVVVAPLRATTETPGPHRTAGSRRHAPRPEWPAAAANGRAVLKTHSDIRVKTRMRTRGNRGNGATQTNQANHRTSPRLQFLSVASVTSC